MHFGSSERTESDSSELWQHLQPPGQRQSCQRRLFSCLENCLRDVGLQPEGTTPAVLSEDSVYAHEYDVVTKASCLHEGRGQTPFSIAFSGGGVRSQAFCCGVLWALAEAGRLQDVTHLSSVSGGSVAASSYASFLAARQAPVGNASRRWYLDVVADLIERCQRNAGYLVRAERQPGGDSGSASLRRQIVTALGDLFLLIGVLSGVLLVAPAIFVVYYIVPVSLVLEAYWGGPLREVYCQHHARDKMSIIERAGQPSLVILVTLVSVAVLVNLVGDSCWRLTHRVRSVHRQQLNSFQREHVGRSDSRYLYLRSVKAMLCRWSVFLVLVMGSLLLVYAAQEQLDAGKGDRLQVCLSAYASQHQYRCSDLRSFEKHDDGEPWYCDLDLSRAVNPTCNTTRLRAIDMHSIQWPVAENVPSAGRQRHAVAAPDELPPPQDTHPGPPLFFIVFLAIALWAVVGAVAAFLGSPVIMFMFIAIMLPLLFLLLASFLLQWIAFGPITGQGLIVINRMEVTPITGRYDDGLWTRVSVCCLLLAILGLPLFNKLHRFVHHYFRVRLQHAFYMDGSDVPMSKIATIAHVPVLLFGATLTDFHRPQDQDANSMFVLSQHHVGCERTAYIAAPTSLTLSKCMSVSCAAIDAFVLTQVNTWHTRILLAFLNLTQGDWMRFDTGRNWHGLTECCPPRCRHHYPALDRLPEVLLWSSIYLCLILAQVVRKTDSATACDGFWALNGTALALFTIFIGIGSFFPHVKWVAWLSASPLVRQIHMFMMNHTITVEPPMFLYLTDGGPVEDLGIVQLLRRHSRWILSVDAGDDPDGKLLDLHTAIALARKEKTCSFFSPEDPRRDIEQVLEAYTTSSCPYLHLGVLYNDKDGCPSDEVGDIFLLRMRVFEDDSQLVKPLIARSEVLGGRAASDRRHVEVPRSLAELQRRELNGICCHCCHGWCQCGPSFPNTHTVNQFFTPIMWANFCRLGYELAGPTVARFTEAQREDGFARPLASSLPRVVLP